MTARKSALPLPARTPAFVSREIGAAELCVCPATWDRMVARGELPPPDHRIGGNNPRWRWDRILAWLSGDKEDATIPRDPYIEGAERAKAKEQRRG